MNETDCGKLIKAYELAARQHKDQRRKDTDASPYINHPIGLPAILWEIGGVRDADVLIAAVLHDTLEDTVDQGSDADRALQAEIVKEFGKEVLELVLAVTDDKSVEKQKRKLLQIQKAPTLSSKAKLIKLADKISNVTDVSNNPPSGWDLDRRIKYLSWAKAVVDAAQSDSIGLNARFQSVYTEGMEKLLKEQAVKI